MLPRMCVLTQGCEDGGDIWLSHVGAIWGVAIWRCCGFALFADGVSRSAGTRSVWVRADGGRRTKRRRMRRLVAGLGRKWKARDLALRCVLPPQVRAPRSLKPSKNITWQNPH